MVPESVPRRNDVLPRHDKLRYVVGSPDGFCPQPLPVFAPQVRAFLARLSNRLMTDPASRAFADVVAFAWWCRKANIERQAAAYADGAVRLGRGIAFHVSPSNVPVNYLFSWAFALLAGNASLVRLPERSFPQTTVVLAHIESLLQEQTFGELRAMNVFLSYGREEELNAALSAIADVRIIWGGDDTVRILRKAPLPPRAVDVAFADRYSFCVLGASAILDLDGPGLTRLAAGFYNDTYVMDQNACSSPRLVVWLGHAEDARAAQTRFWAAVHEEVTRRFELAAVSAVDKLTQACRDAIELQGMPTLDRMDNGIYRVHLDALFPGIEDRRCNCGYFYEYVSSDLDEVAPIVTSKYQTLTRFGVDKELLASFVLRHRLTGIDRIVPVGAAMDMGLIWDGYELIRTLSRLCYVE
jgi:hypothetical protein